MSPAVQISANQRANSEAEAYSDLDVSNMPHDIIGKDIADHGVSNEL